MTDYRQFIESKSQTNTDCGFEPVWTPDFLFDFQRHLTEWAIRRGRSAIFADCGLGKTPMQLVWAQNVVEVTNKPVLVATPLAVSYQLLQEAEKFGVAAERSSDGKFTGANVVVTNYERLANFNRHDFGGMVCDESSILKNFNGSRRALITETMREMPYRLLCTATAAPNDYTELGTSSEALGELGHMDMLSRFFKNDQNTSNTKGGGAARWNGHSGPKWRFRGHAERDFWRWVGSWARAVRRPSDIGFEDGKFKLPELVEREHTIKVTKPRNGMLFNVPAVGLAEQREERRATIKERCELAARLVAESDYALVWCHLNDESSLLAELIDGAVEVSGSDSDDAKESKLRDFATGQTRVLVTKPKIGAWGLNLQHCAHMTFFPSHSYEQYYQGVRRCWRFGQERPVRVDIVSSEGERDVLLNLQRKAAAADAMFESMMEHVNESLTITRTNEYTQPEEMPVWL